MTVKNDEGVMPLGWPIYDPFTPSYSCEVDYNDGHNPLAFRILSKNTLLASIGYDGKVTVHVDDAAEITIAAYVIILESLKVSGNFRWGMDSKPFPSLIDIDRVRKAGKDDATCTAP